jgi:hypothetical protein
MTPRKFTAGVKDGKLPVEVAKSIGRAIAELDGRFCQVSVGEYVPIRSQQQNRFWFGVIVPEVQAHLAQFGAVLSPEEVHDWLVKEVWKHSQIVIMHDGSAYTKRLSSTKLTKAEWEDRIEMTRAYWAERGLMLSYPNE